MQEGIVDFVFEVYWILKKETFKVIKQALQVGLFERTKNMGNMDLHA